MFTEPSLVNFSAAALRKFTKLAEGGPQGLVPCISKYHRIYDIVDGDKKNEKYDGYHFGWCNPEDVPESAKGKVNNFDCAYKLGAPKKRKVIIDYNGEDFVVLFVP